MPMDQMPPQAQPQDPQQPSDDGLPQDSGGVKELAARVHTDLMKLQGVLQKAGVKGDGISPVIDLYTQTLQNLAGGQAGEQEAPPQMDAPAPKGGATPLMQKQGLRQAL